MSNNEKMWNTVGWFTLAACVLSPVPLIVGFLTAFGMCSDTSFVEMAFPYAVAVDPTLVTLPLLVLGLAVIQFPVYGIASGFAWALTRNSQGARLAAFGALLAIHSAFAIVAATRVDQMWAERFSHTRTAAMRHQPEQSRRALNVQCNAPPN